MHRSIERSAAALQDLDELVEYFRTTSVDLAQKFVAAAESTFQFLAQNREVGQLCAFAHPELVGMRVWRMDRFRNHLVFFRSTADGIEIVKVLHGARNIDAIFGEDAPKT